MKTQPYHIVRNSKIHGKGVFAKRPIRKGTKIIEYTGDIITVKEADKRGVQTDNGHGHTMLFTVDEKRVIDGNTGGDAKYVNHSCSPNCETVQDGDKIFIESLRSIPKGQELTYDYHLVVEGKITEDIVKEFACFCGSPNCRHTQIAASIMKKYKKKLAKKKAKEKAKAAKKAEKAKVKAAKKAEKQRLKAEKKALKEKEKSAKNNEAKLMKQAKPSHKLKPKKVELSLMIQEKKKDKKKKKAKA